MAAFAAMALSDSSEDDEESEEKEADKDDDAGGDDVEQMGIMVDDWGDDDGKSKKKKKKEKKDKKEKKAKKEKKKKKEKNRNSDGESENSEEKAARKKAKKERKKAEAAAAAAAEEGNDDDGRKKPLSKFEQQMQDALKKKEAEEEAAASTAAPDAEDKDKKKPKKKSGLAAASVEQGVGWVDTAAETKKKSEDASGEVLYGAPDDHAWTDKSAAQMDAESSAAKAAEDEKNLLYDPVTGKKLSNKERKRRQKAKEAAERMADFEVMAAKQSAEGAQFACSQSAVNENDATWANSLDVNIPNFSISAAGKILFKDAALTIGHGRHYGLVGPNGRGKSTLLKMIASRDLKLPPRIDFLYVEQEVVADDTPAVEAVLKADKRRWSLLQEESSLMAELDAADEEGGDDGDVSAEKVERLQQVVDELVSMGADSAEAKARRILYGLGFTVDMQTKPTRMFSGGWRMRISLARALFMEPTLLMLDEPTNHLDLNAVIWLDEYLQKWKKTLFVVSHDQDFMNSVCQEILHIEDLKLASYRGNYDSFKKAEKIKFQQAVKAWEKQEKRIRELKKTGKVSKAKATEQVKTKSKREAGARSQKKKNQLVAAGSEAAEITELVKRPKVYQVKLEFVDVAELSRPVMQVENVHFRYSPKHPVIFDNIDFGIDMDSRICIVGPNGSGKSTLVKLLTGELEPTKGEVRRNPRLR